MTGKGHLEVSVATLWRRGRESVVEVLCARRRAGDTLGGFWELPGGKIEPGEHPLAGAVREVLEETGIELDGSEGAWLDCGVVAPSAAPRFHVFVHRTAVTAEALPLESEECRWVPLPDLEALGFPPANRTVTARVIEALRDLGLR